MFIEYKDEYDTQIFWHSKDTAYPANVGDTVVFNEEEYRVQSRVYYPKENQMSIVVTQSSARAPVAEKAVDAGRLNQLNAAIINTNKRIDASDKKSRAVTEQVGSIRKHINQRIQQDKKDKDENR